MNAGDIMSMAGLDNEDVTKGYNNFKTMHKLVDNLAELAHCPKSERTKLLHDRINNISDWHKSNFMRHLGDDKDHCCQCLSCGYIFARIHVYFNNLHGKTSPLIIYLLLLYYC